MIYILFCFIAFILFNSYWFANIKNLREVAEGGASLGMRTLLVSLVMFLALLLWQALVAKHIRLQRFFLIFLLFSAYFVFKIIVDIADVAVLRAFTIATTGGIFFFYTIGAIIGILLYRIKKLTMASVQCAKMVMFLFFIYLLCHSYMLFTTFVGLGADVRIDRFLLSDLGGAYQRPGAFLVMSTFVLSILYMNSLLSGYVNFRHTFLLNLFRIICFCIYVAVCLTSMILAQLIGSNNALICISGMLILAVAFHILLFYPKIRFILNNRAVKLKEVISRDIRKGVVKSAFVSVACVAAVLIIVMATLQIDVSMLRITGFGDGETSVSSRNEILSSFPDQFFHSVSTPFFGHMLVHELSEAPNYIHSFLGSILTHLGIVGFLIVTSFLYMALKNLFQTESSVDLYTNGMNIYKTLLFVGIFVVATSSVFLHWSPIWFLTGILFVPVRFINGSSGNYNKIG